MRKQDNFVRTAECCRKLQDAGYTVTRSSRDTYPFALDAHVPAAAVGLQFQEILSYRASQMGGLVRQISHNLSDI